MKKSFVRGLWGVYDDSNRITKRRFRVKRNVQQIVTAKHTVPFVTYVFGEENFVELKELGVNAILLDKNPAPFNLVRHQYRNKIEILMHAMEDFDEIVYMDWDVYLKAKLPSDMWEKLGNRASIQACLQQYHRPKCPWRKDDWRKVPNGGFVYLRDKQLPSLAATWWEKLGSGDNDEPAWARIIDEMMGGWQGMEAFWKEYEIMYCNLRGMNPYPDNRIIEKHAPFIHYQGGK